jgi:hypothetical protein
MVKDLILKNSSYIFLIMNILYLTVIVSFCNIIILIIMTIIIIELALVLKGDSNE